MENINAEEIHLGKNVFIHPTAKITGINGKAKKVKIGDNTYIGHNVEIIVNEIEIGDYCKIHHHCNIHGVKPCKIGHNAWIGQFTIIDTQGGTTIGNNFGAGAHSQLWSHILYGDTLEGCRFMSYKELNIGNDVWVVGHCIVSPVNIADKAMALVGSVITKDLEYNKIYGGSPAKDITDKLGPQFDNVDIETKYQKMCSYFEEFGSPKDIKIVRSVEDFNLKDEITYFDVDTRKYTKKYNQSEIEFMRFLLPTKAKFIPYE